MSLQAAHNPGPRLYAHRGIAARFPENTLASFRAARDEGCRAIELDVQRTKDGRLVVFHDDDLVRLCGSPSRIVDLDFAELQAFDVGAWMSPAFKGERIPELADVFKVWGGSGRINVELKSVTETDAALARDVAAFLRGRAEDVIVSSFDWELLELFHTNASQTPLAVLFEGDRWDAALECAKRLRARSVNPNVIAASEGRIVQARASALEVTVYTVNDAALAARLFAMGATGLFTDDAPRLARELTPREPGS